MGRLGVERQAPRLGHVESRLWYVLFAEKHLRRFEAEKSYARVLKRAAQRTGRPPCWSPRLEGARGSGTVKECQGLVGGIP